MTASQKAKSMGLKSLTEVSEHTRTSLQTLINWHKNKPELFNVVLIGCRNISLNQYLRNKDANQQSEIGVHSTDLNAQDTNAKYIPVNKADFYRKGE